MGLMRRLTVDFFNTHPSCKLMGLQFDHILPFGLNDLCESGVFNSILKVKTGYIFQVSLPSIVVMFKVETSGGWSLTLL
jgi:hypothetical protein